MSMYRFKIEDGIGGADPEPIALVDYRAARSMAVILLGEMLKDASGTFWHQRQCKVEVSNEQGLVLCSLNVVGIEAEAVLA